MKHTEKERRESKWHTVKNKPNSTAAVEEVNKIIPDLEKTTKWLSKHSLVSSLIMYNNKIKLSD